MNVSTRFAPSPTGSLHIGSLRTALFSYLWAKKHNGSFRLRIEDTDQKREVPGAKEHLIEILDYFNLKHDDEIVIQSDNAKTGVYTKFAQKLISNGHAYHCFCTEERLKQVREDQQTRKLPPRYDGTCRSLSPEDAQKNLEHKKPSVVRLRIPEHEELHMVDGIHGTITFNTSTLTDAVLLKSDGLPTYHLANVVDDHLMHITHVIRGEEWIPSLPLHVLLYRYLDVAVPKFYHLPLILNADRSKLSKRQGDVSVESYLEKGYLREALINYIAFLGWNPGDEREIFSLEQLIDEFDLEDVNKAGSIFNIEKLNWYNGWYIRNILAPKPTTELAMALEPHMPDQTPEQRVSAFSLFFERIATLSELASMAEFLWKVPFYDPKLLIYKKSSPEKTIQGLQLALDYFDTYRGQWTHINLELGLKQTTQDHSLTFGDVFWPVRVALSGLAASPAPTEIAAALGKNEAMRRLKHALSIL